MKIGIIGTRGIPDQYGGFERFAEQFSTAMAEKGYDVTVYTSHRHPYNEDHYKNVRLVRCFDPEYILGTAGQFIYDFNCIRDSRTRHFDVIFQLGYTSSTIWSWLYPKSAILVTNMDGLEWSRAKYNKATQYFLTFAEKWGVLYSNYLIADSKGIQDYLKEKYEVNAVLIPYGAEIYEPNSDDIEVLKKFMVTRNEFDLVIARFEPENNIETILKAYQGIQDRKLVLVGNYSNTAFGRRMHREYDAYEHIYFAGAIYDTAQLNSLRYHSRLYMHGHSVGGTNPSLLEAMGCDTVICAHDNIFNRYVLGGDAFYFKTTNDLISIISEHVSKDKYENWLGNNRDKISNYYNWDALTEKIELYFKQWKYGKKYRQELSPA
jgi:glycosyltransferase involved in cell wall biosynthesis